MRVLKWRSVSAFSSRAVVQLFSPFSFPFLRKGRRRRRGRRKKTSCRCMAFMRAPGNCYDFLLNIVNKCTGHIP
jgi:hypothetical protein